MPVINVIKYNIRVILNRNYYPMPSRTLPIDLEGTVLFIETFSRWADRRVRRGDILELLAGVETSNEDGIAKIRWDHDVKNWIDFGSLIIRSSNLSMCKNIWKDHESIRMDTRDFHELNPCSINKQYHIPIPNGYVSHDIGTMHDALNTISAKQKEQLVKGLAYNNEWKRYNVSTKNIKWRHDEEAREEQIDYSYEVPDQERGRAIKMDKTMPITNTRGELTIGQISARKEKMKGLIKTVRVGSAIPVEINITGSTVTGRSTELKNAEAGIWEQPTTPIASNKHDRFFDLNAEIDEDF